MSHATTGTPRPYARPVSSPAERAPAPGPVQAERTVSASALPAAEQWAEQVLHGWGVRSPLQRAWLEAVELAQGECLLSFEYDADAGLLAVEVWRDGRRLWGLDDWIG